MSKVIATNIGDLITEKTIPTVMMLATVCRSGSIAGYESTVLTLETGNFGYTSVTDTATGTVTHNLSVTFSAATYAACANSGHETGYTTTSGESNIAYYLRTTTSFATNISNASTGADEDREVYAVTIGELA